jgi:hypothetical protein
MQTSKKNKNHPGVLRPLRQQPKVSPLGNLASGLGPTDAQKTIISGKRPIGPWMVAILDVLLLLGLIVVGFADSTVLAWSITVSLLFSAQAALLFIPHKVVRRRPVRRGDALAFL